MAEEGFDTLVNTLISNHLAASQSEAIRMAEEMLGTSKKINESFQKQRHHYAVKNFSPESSTKKTETTVTTTLDSETKSDLMKQKIQELRERAINPEPVIVQVEFDTPRGAPSISQSLPPVDEESSAQVQEKSAPMSNPQESSWIEQPRKNPEINSEKEMTPKTEPVVAEPVLTPEEYSAQNMNRGISLIESLEQPKDIIADEPVPRQEETNPRQATEPVVEEPLANDSNYDGFPQPNQEQSFDSKPEPILEPVLETLATNPEFQNEQQTPLAQEQNDFLSLKQEPNENPLPEEINNQTVPPNSDQAAETISGWPSSQNETTVFRPSLEQQQEVVSVQAPVQKEQITEKTQEIITEKKRPELTPEEKELHDSVDITKIFNFGNR